MADSLARKHSAEVTRREREDELEAAMLQQPQAECPVVHRFGPGTYIREVTIPAGTLAIGHYQNFPHTCILLKGHLTMLNADNSTSELHAPLIYTCPPGRKISYSHTEMVWLNIYPTEEKDIETLESHYLTKSTGWQINESTLKGIKLLSSSVAKQDYALALSDLGMNEEDVRRISECTDDMTELPYGDYKIKLGDSAIEGRGLFATAPISEGELIAPARIEGKRTIAGRFTNHSATPNAAMVQGHESSIDLVALTDIRGCIGGQDGDEITINYRDAVKLTLSLSKGESSCQQ